MCTPIYYIHNVTLWTCPEKIICPTSVPAKNNQTNVNVSKNNQTNATLNNQTNATLNNQTNATPNNQTNTTLNNQTNATLNNQTNATLNNQTNATVRPSTRYTTPASIEPVNTPSPVYKPNLRHKDVSNYSGNATNDCYCEQRLDYLHVFWAVPLFCLFVCCFWYRRRGSHKINNFYVAYKTRKLRRSKSWPTISSRRSPIDTRSQSEPAFDSIVL
jgi:hypothetical protein